MSIRNTALYVSTTSTPTGPTRFYLPSTGAAAISPTQSSEWDFTTGFDRLKLVTTKINSASATKAAADTTATANRDALIRQYVSDGLEAQTISGTLKGRIRAQENATTANLRAQVIVRVLSNDGSTVRGTLYAGDLTTGTTNPTSEFAATLTNRQYPRGASVALSSVTAQAGDRLVVEIGYRKHAALSTTGTLSFGDNSGTDLAEDETTTAANNPWIEFSGYVQFQSTITPIAASDTLAADLLEDGEVSKPPGFTVRLTTGGHQLRNQTGLREATLLDLPTDKAVSDTLAAGLSDTASAGVDQDEFTADDTADAGLSEAVAIERQSTVADTATASLTEAVALQRQSDVADTGAVDLSDIAAVEQRYAAADTGAVDLTDTASKSTLDTKSASDTGAVDLTESTALEQRKTGSDTGTAGLTESVALERQATVADTGSVNLTEAVTLQRQSTVADTGPVDLTDTVALAVAMTRADTGAVDATDSASTSTLDTKSASDTGAVDLTDASSVAIVTAKAGSDTGAVGLTDTATAIEPPTGPAAYFARGGLIDRPAVIVAAIQSRPVPVAGTLAVRPGAATATMAERPVAIAGALSGRPAAASGGLSERPSPLTGTLRER